MHSRKRIIYPISSKKSSEELQTKCDLVWEMFCKNGSVCINDLSVFVDNDDEILKQDPHVFSRAHCDYYFDNGQEL